MRFEYISEKTLTIEQILEVRDKARESFTSFGSFSDFSPRGVQFGEIVVKGKLPPLDRGKGVTFLSFYIVGYLPVKEKSFAELFKILDRSENEIGQEANVSISIGFQAINSEENKRYHDRIKASERKGKYYFEYGSTKADVGIRRDFFQRLIETASLPLNFIIKDNDYCIEHMNKGELFTSGGTGETELERNPSFFRCEISAEAFRNIQEVIKKVLDTLATEKRYEYSWTVTLEDMDKEVANRLYDLAASKDFSANRCDINFSYRLDKIEGVGVLQQWCKKKGEFGTFLCNFSLQDDNSGELTVITKQEGHRIELTLDNFEHLQLVEEELGVKFKEY